MTPHQHPQEDGISLSVEPSNHGREATVVTVPSLPSSTQRDLVHLETQPTSGVFEMNGFLTLYLIATWLVKILHCVPLWTI